VLRLQAAAAFVENPAAASGQLSSLLTGLQHADARRADAVAVLPVDTPQVRPATVAALIASTAARPIVRATFEGRHGHPVLFRREVFDELRRADPARGARVVLHAEPARVLDLQVDDPGVIRDIDNPEDYAALYGHRV
jgi:molybdenum cofactor cytidylyltransferase